ncbi:MAG: DUF4260 family protein, partial [Sulfitobacter sp.]
MTTDHIMPHRLVARSNPVRIILHLEGAGIAIICGLIFGQIGGAWWVFVALLLAPDLFMLGYLAGPRVGAAAYNLGHSYLSPLLLAGVGAGTDSQTLLMLALIWGA